MISSSHEPIAIVGLACRLPGRVDSPESYWQLLEEERDAIEPFPPERWDVADLYSADPDAPGKTYCTHGGFVHDVDRFDAAFFGISPREAEAMEPAQRLALECVWEMLERAGILPGELAQTQTGVYFGAFNSDYEPWGGRQGMVGMNGYAFTGRDSSVLSGRISYTLGLHGPSLTVQTACSSSLVALHLACQALRVGECNLALCGGSQVMTMPGCFVEFARLRGLASDGRCKSFSDNADGAGWSEGCAVLLLQRLSDARREGRRILALVRSTAINHDGRSQGLTAPSGPAQQQMIVRALEQCGLSPHDIDVIEAHGTGTMLGDPIEASALGAVFGPGRPADRPLYIGSVKSNIGHTQAASGIAGVIKLVLALEKERLPRSLHSETPSRRIQWEGSGLRILSEARDWRRGERVRRAGVNSFGISGTNSHAILEEAPEDVAAPEGPPSVAERQLPPTVPLLVSATDRAGLIDQVVRLAEHIDRHPETSAIDLAYTLAARTHHPARLAAALAPDLQATALSASLRSFARGESAEFFTGVVSPRPGKLVVLFPGQGSQRPEMGRRLYSQYPDFREALDRICAELDRTLQRPLRELLFAPQGTEDASLLDQTEYTQPALFALSVALYRLWEAWGLVPDLLLGHSIGELAAAHVAGVLSLEDACKLVASRGRLMQGARGGGAMFAVSARDTEVAELILGLEDRVSIAAVNGPEQTVLSGDAATAEEIAKELEGMGKRVRRLRVSHAFHSPHMDGILDEYRQVAQSLTYHAPQIAMLGNLNGAIAGERICNPEYWVRQLRGAVRFRNAMRTAEKAGADRYIECGPGAVLSSMAANCVKGDNASFIPSLRGDRDEAESFGEALVRAHAAGVALRWDRVFAGLDARRVDLPSYGFQRKRYWLEDAGHPEGVVEGVGLGRITHDILRAHTSLPDGGHLFTARLSRLRVPWLVDHELLGRVVVPAMSIADLLLAAGSHVGASQLSSLTLEAPLILDSSMKLLLRLEPADEQGERAFSLHACTTGAGGDGPWTRHASGSLDSAAPAVEQDSVAPPVDATVIDLSGLYERLARKGLRYGPGFRGLREVHKWGENLYARLELPAELQPHGYALHPAILDAGFHALMAAADDDAALRVPFELRRMWVARRESSPRALRVHLVMDAVDAAGMPLEARMHFHDESGEPVAMLGWVGLRAISLDKLREPPRAPAQTRRAPEGHLYRMQWVARPALGRVGGCAVVGAGSLANEVAAALRTSGVPVVRYNRSEDTLEGLEQQDAGIATIVRAIEPVDEGDADAALQAVIDLAQELATWTASNRLVNHRYVVLTSRAVATGAAEAPALAHAPLWGLVRTVRSESANEQWTLLDTDATEASHQALAAALAAGEVEAALRRGQRLVPRLVRDDAEAAVAPRNHGTVLVTGGTGGLGAEVAKHLAAAGRVKHLLLLSRQGMQAPGAPALVQEIESMGCGVTLAAADVADREAVERALKAVPDAVPLTGVFHCAAVLDDALAPSADRITHVFAAKAIGAWNLHQLTLHHDLKEFVLFSSIAGIMGNEGQSAYAAANTFLDALGASRRALGLPAHSLAWGTWAKVGMAARLSARHQERLQGAGLSPLSVDSALALMERALGSSQPLLVPLRVHKDLLRSQDAGTPLGRLLFGTASPSPKKQPKPAGLSLRERIDAVHPDERGRILLDLVRAEVAAVLKLPNAEDLHEEKPLDTLGMDSLMGVDIRRRLEKRLSMRLPPTVVFDHPSCRALASYLLESWMEARS